MVSCAKPTIKMNGRSAPPLNLRFFNSCKEFGLGSDQAFLFESTLSTRATHIADFLRLCTLKLGSFTISRNDMTGIFQRGRDPMYLFQVLGFCHTSCTGAGYTRYGYTVLRRRLKSQRVSSIIARWHDIRFLYNKTSCRVNTIAWRARSI